MYNNQGSKNSTQFRHGPRPPLNPIPIPLPPPPPPHRPQFHNGPFPHLVNQQPRPSHVYHQPVPSPIRYPPPTFLQLQPSGIRNAGQPSVHYPPPVTHGYPTQQTTQHPSNFGKVNVYPPQQSLHPSRGPPPRVLPSSSQGQTWYRAPVHQSLQHLPPPHPPASFGNSVHATGGNSHMPSTALPPPPPRPSHPLPPPPPRPLPSASFGNLIHTAVGDSHMPSTTLPPPPPPPPTSPLPLPPPPPHPTSPHVSYTPLQAATNVPCLSESNSDLGKIFSSGMNVLQSVVEKTAFSSDREKLSEQYSCFDHTVASGIQEGSVKGNDPLLNGNMILDISPTPLKPKEETVRRIETFCGSITNGRDNEYMALQNESGNPEFEFLFGGKPGSEAAIAHDYFLWMKRKWTLPKLDKLKSESSDKTLTVDDHLIDVAVSHLPADSDMEMEDDITQSDDVQVEKEPIESQDFESSVDNKSIEREFPAHSSAEHKQTSDVLLENPASSILPGQCESGLELYSPFDIESSFSNDHNPSEDSTGVLKSPSGSKSVKRSSLEADDRSPSEDLLVVESNSSDKICQERISDESPFRHIQGYASDYSIENEDESIKIGAIAIKSITAVPVDKHDEGKCETRALKNIVIPSEDLQNQDACEDGASSGKLNKSTDRSAKVTPSLPKVDEFGRLVKESVSVSNSDSDSYDSRHTRRRGKRSRYRSQSPPKRRRRMRSPQRRRRRRSRSRSSSPECRSRSRSPSYKRVGESMGVHSRRDKNRVPDCFDFRRGRCYRGASCRFQHHDSEKVDESSRHYRNKLEHLEVPPSSSRNMSSFQENLDISIIQPEKKLEEVIVSEHVDLDVTKPEIHKDGVAEIVGAQRNKCQEAMESLVEMVVDKIPSESEFNADAQNSCVGDSQVVSPLELSLIQQPEPNVSHQLPQREKSAISDLSPDQTSLAIPNNVPHMAQQLRTDFTVISSAPVEAFPSYMLPSQHSVFTAPSNSSWVSLPPPPQIFTPHNSNIIRSQNPGIIPLHFNQAQSTSRNNFDSGNFPRPYSNEFLSYSQVGENKHGAYPPMQVEDYRLQNLPVFNLSHQQFGGTGSLAAQPSVHPPVQGFSALNSLSHSKNHLQLTNFSQDVPNTGFPSHNMAPFDISRTAAHYNPYASTFEQPLVTKFNPQFLMQEKSSINVQGFDGTGLRQGASSSRPGGNVGQNFSRFDSEGYDPLSDSFEPASNSFNKSSHVQNQESAINNVKEGSAVLATSLDNEEFGETADAEVGAVENANMSGSDIEIDQIKSPGKRKKRKESRLMRLFKVAVADFVKEALKPSWRQGNMSKEAFKTIVKKTVEKVSGAMKSHQIPKSQTRINQYIDSSQRKLTRLITGYVERYVKS